MKTVGACSMEDLSCTVYIRGSRQSHKRSLGESTWRRSRQARDECLGAGARGITPRDVISQAGHVFSLSTRSCSRERARHITIRTRQHKLWDYFRLKDMLIGLCGGKDA
jgi:hypothetical protein